MEDGEFNLEKKVAESELEVRECFQLLAILA